MSFMSPPKPKPAAPPPTTPTAADTSVVQAGQESSSGYSSLINTGMQGLSRKAKTVKSSLIGGA